MVTPAIVSYAWADSTGCISLEFNPRQGCPRSGFDFVVSFGRGTFADESTSAGTEMRADIWVP
jgi:hypothetical protein